MRVRRLTSDDGSPSSGACSTPSRCALSARASARRRSRHDRRGGLRGGEERGSALSLANGWRLARRRLMGRNRIELEGPADTDLPALRRMGCTVEIVSFRARDIRAERRCDGTHPRPLAARRLSRARIIRIAGPPHSGGAGPSAAITRVVGRGGPAARHSAQRQARAAHRRDTYCRPGGGRSRRNPRKPPCLRRPSRTIRTSVSRPPTTSKPRCSRSAS